jgi:hypothetical protein
METEWDPEEKITLGDLKNPLKLAEIIKKLNNEDINLELSVIELLIDEPTLIGYSKVIQSFSREGKYLLYKKREEN